MKHKYKPGDMFEMEPFTNKGNFTEEILVIVEPTEASCSGVAYKVYNQTFQMFMDRTQMFLDQFYKKVG